MVLGCEIEGDSVLVRGKRTAAFAAARCCDVVLAPGEDGRAGRASRSTVRATDRSSDGDFRWSQVIHHTLEQFQQYIPLRQHR